MITLLLHWLRGCAPAFFVLLAACGGGDDDPIAPSITAHPASATRVVGQTADFSVDASGSGPLAYQWRRNGADIAGANAAGYTTPVITAADHGAQFSVVVSNSAGSVTSDAATLTAGPAVAPSIVTQPVATSVVAGALASFSVGATGSDPLAYQWQRDGVAIAGATAASYTTPATALADNGASYTVVVANAGGSATSNAAVLSVTAAPVAPTITAQPASAIVNEGQTATFSVTAAGSAPLAYQWRRDGADIAGATAANYTTPATLAADSGARFSVVVGNGTPPNAVSGDATLTVTPVVIAPAITTHPASVSVNAGQTASFTVVATGTSPSYQWQRNGAAIAGATSASYTTAATTAADNGATFAVRVANAAGSVTSGSATLNIATAVAVMSASRLSTGWDGFSTLARKADGTLWGWGDNRLGQLGNDVSATVASPVQIAVAGPVVALGAQEISSAVVSADGTVHTTGFNRNGVLGTESSVTQSQYSFQPATVISEVVWIAGGNEAYAAIKRDGSLWQWGASLVLPDYGLKAARVGTLTNMVSATLGQGGFRFALRDDGTVWFWGSNQNDIAAGAAGPGGSATPLKVPGIDDVVALTSGAGHVLAVRRDGTVWTWGWGSQGQLGYTVTAPTGYGTVPKQVPGLTDVVAVAGGWDHSLALRRDGTVWAWGSNEKDSLCLGFTSTFEPPRAIPGLAGVTDISAGHEQSVFAKVDGSVWSCGLSVNDALGIPGVTRANVPTQVPGLNLN